MLERKDSLLFQYNNDGDYPLHVAVKHCRERDLQLLLNSVKCDVRAMDRYGRTPLQLAIELGRQPVTRLLQRRLGYLDSSVDDASSIGGEIQSWQSELFIASEERDRPSGIHKPSNTRVEKLPDTDGTIPPSLKHNPSKSSERL